MNNIGTNVVSVDFKEKETIEYKPSESTYIVDATITLQSGEQKLIQNIEFVPQECFTTDISSGEVFYDRKASDDKYIEARGVAFSKILLTQSLSLGDVSISFDDVEFSKPYYKVSEEKTIKETTKTILSIVSK